jgi:hypothetical protein
MSVPTNEFESTQERKSATIRYSNTPIFNELESENPKEVLTNAADKVPAKTMQEKEEEISQAKEIDAEFKNDDSGDEDQNANTQLNESKKAKTEKTLILSDEEVKKLKKKEHEEMRAKYVSERKEESNRVAQAEKESKMILSVECCVNCIDHSYCTHHKENKYKEYMSTLKAQIEKLNPEIYVSKNGKVETPRIGALEVVYKNQVIYSKLKEMKWPNSELVAKTIRSIIDKEAENQLSQKDEQETKNEVQIIEIQPKEIIEKPKKHQLNQKEKIEKPKKRQNDSRDKAAVEKKNHTRTVSNSLSKDKRVLVEKDKNKKIKSNQVKQSDHNLNGKEKINQNGIIRENDKPKVESDVKRVSEIDLINEVNKGDHKNNKENENTKEENNPIEISEKDKNEIKNKKSIVEIKEDNLKISKLITEDDKILSIIEERVDNREEEQEEERSVN